MTTGEATDVGAAAGGDAGGAPSSAGAAAGGEGGVGSGALFLGSVGDASAWPDATGPVLPGEALSPDATPSPAGPSGAGAASPDGGAAPTMLRSHVSRPVAAGETRFTWPRPTRNQSKGLCQALKKKDSINFPEVHGDAA